MLANLRALFGVVVDIVLLRRGPEQLPASPALLGIVIAIYLAVSAALYALMPNNPLNWPLLLLAGAVFLLLWFHAGLGLAQKRERFVQTMTAIFAASTLFVPALVPLESALRPYFLDPENVKSPPPLVALPALVLGIWLLVVEVRIVRAAFEWTLIPSLIFILAQNFVTAFLLALLFGDTRPPA